MNRLTEKGKGAIRRMAVVDSTDGPSAADLRAIDAEWPVIAAEVAVTDAEVAFLRAPGDVTAFRLAKAERALRRVLAERRAAAARGCGGAA